MSLRCRFLLPLRNNATHKYDDNNYKVYDYKQRLNMKRVLTKMAIMLTAIMIVLSATSCKRKMSPGKLLEKCGSGVVMILNQYYYKVSLPTGASIFFAGIDEDGNLSKATFDENEANQNRNMCTGTGFFVSDDGKILTNRHVAQPAVDVASTKKSVHNMLNNLKIIIERQMNEYSSQFDALDSEKANCYSYDYDGNVYADQNKLEQIAAKQKEIADNFRKCKQIREQLDNIDISEIKVETVCELGVAYNDTYVTKLADFKPCVVSAISDKENVDLAMLQLKDKRTPDEAYVFALTDSNGKVETGETLYMIGYNAGFTVSNTSQGIKVQITSGQISQNSDSYKMLYTIPALPGSSGSPVIDAYGNLAAVNFAGFSSTQGFNYGIQYKRVKQFVDGI